jgi:hypothetical protein
MLDNPRVELSGLRQQELDASLLSLGLFRPLLVWRGEAGDQPPVVIGGNQRLGRLRVLMARGHDRLVLHDGTEVDVPVTTYHGPEAAARLVALRDNNSDGDWDWTALSAFTTDLQQRLEDLAGSLEGGLTLAGFDAHVLADLASYNPPAAPEPEPPKDPEPQPEPKSERKLSDPDENLVTVRIGHVRGKLRASTYERLVKALAIEVDQEDGEGLDAAFVGLLERL